MMMYANCLLPQAIDHELTYAIPEALAGAVRPGARVVVPLRSGSAVALVTALAGPPPRGVAAKPLLELLDPEPLYDAAMLAFLRWVGDYYLAPAGLVLRAALPGAARKPPKRAREEEPPAAAEATAPYGPEPTSAQRAAADAIGAAVDAGTFARSSCTA